MSKPLVMDLGMHDGRDTAFYLAQGYRVVAVDADPVHIDAARTRFADAIACGDLTLECCGLALDDGAQTFYRSANTEWSSFDEGRASRENTATEAVVVPVRNPRFLFEQYGIPHYLKIDIEGSDKCVIGALAALGRRPTFCSMEITWTRDIAAVASLGYRRFALVDQSQLPTTGNPSGPFGDAIPRHCWTTAAKAEQQYIAARAAGVTWFDIHAR